MADIPDGNTFFIEENSAHIDVYLCSNGIGVEGARWMDSHSAQQLANALRAVLSGQFVRATSQSNFEFDLECQAARRRNPRLPPSTSFQPELDML